MGAEAEAENVEERCSRACSSWLAQLAFLYNPGPHAWSSTSHSVLSSQIHH